MTKLELQTAVSGISLVTGQNTLIQQSLNFALNRIYSDFDFPYYLQDKGVIKTVASYSTGTVNVINGSTALTFAGSTLTADMANRKIRLNGENANYKFSSVNTGAGTAVLEQPYQGSSNALATFVIFQDEFRLASDLDKYKTFRQLQNNLSLFQYPITTFDERHPMPTAYADPISAMMIGTRLDTSTTGTVSGTVNTSVLTGVSTAWTEVDGLGRLSKITIPNTGVSRNVYTVKSVDSDTQITIYETLTSTIPALSTYLITLNNVRVQLYQIPNAQRLLYYRYFRIPEPLNNDWDIPDLPHSWHWLLIYGALSFIYLYKGDMKDSQLVCEQRFVEGVGKMKLKLGSFAPDMIHNIKSQDRISRGRKDGLESSSYDRRYST